MHSWVGKGQTVVRSAHPIDQQYINIEGSREPPLRPPNPTEAVFYVNTHSEKTDGVERCSDVDHCVEKIRSGTLARFQVRSRFVHRRDRDECHPLQGLKTRDGTVQEIKPVSLI